MWESGLNIDALLTALIGFEPDAFHHRATFSPWIPAKWKFIRSGKLRIGETYCSLFSERKGKKERHTIESLSGHPLEVQLNLRSQHSDTVHSSTKHSTTMNGKSAEISWRKNRFGIYQSTIFLSLEPGEKHVIEF